MEVPIVLLKEESEELGIFECLIAEGTVGVAMEAVPAG